MAIKKPPEPSSDGRVDTKHHHYRIIAGRRNAAGHAIGYLGKDKFDETIGDTVEAAVEALKKTLDEHRDALRRERVGDVPTTKEFVEALTVLKAELPAPVFRVLSAHARMTNSSASTGELGRLGSGDVAAVTADYSRLGRKLGAILGFTPDAQKFDRSFAAMQSFAVLEAAAERTMITLRLRPQMVAALRPSGGGKGLRGAGTAATDGRRGDAGTPS